MLRGFGRPRMWAQYGDNHTGVCLVFDRAALERELRSRIERYGQVWSEEVCYDPVIMAAGGTAFHVDYHSLKQDKVTYRKQHCNHWYKSLFFQKQKDWRDESEWRVTLVDSNIDDCYVAYGGSLGYAVAGSRVKADDLTALRNVSSVPVLRLRFERWQEDRD